MDYGYLERNVGEIRRRIKESESASEYGQSVRMVAAVKYADAGEINHLCSALGVRDIGENRVQQLLEHYEALEDKSVNIHFIGTLQTNKVKYIIDKVCLIHSVDSERLAAEIDNINARTAADGGSSIDTLVAGIENGRRSFKIVRMKPDGKSYARDIADKYGLSYESIINKLH